MLNRLVWVNQIYEKLDWFLNINNKYETYEAPLWLFFSCSRRRHRHLPLSWLVNNQHHRLLHHQLPLLQRICHRYRLIFVKFELMLFCYHNVKSFVLMIILRPLRASESIVLIIQMDLTFVKVGLGVEADFSEM